jgi:hypothetical protein
MSSYLPPKGGGDMTPDKAMQMLFYFHDWAHFKHLQTKSFAEHKALDKLYKGLVDFKDEISELLLGYIQPKRFTDAPKIPVDKNADHTKLLEDLCSFADELYEYGEKTKWWALSNRAADLSGLGYKVKYLLTLS